MSKAEASSPRLEICEEKSPTNLHADDKEVEGDELEQALSVLAQKTQSDWLTLDVEPAIDQLKVAFTVDLDWMALCEKNW